jgi:hypothetical protein
MMQPAQNWQRDDVANRLGTSEARGVIAQRQVGPDLVVVGGVRFQDATQVRLARYHQVVEAFTTNRADEPFDVSVLPRRARRDWVITDAHRTNAPGVRWPERAVAIANEMTRRFAPWKRFRHLTRDPLGRRIAGHGDPEQPPSGVAKNHQALEQLE